MLQRRKGFTTMVELDEFKSTTWSFLANVTMQWQYDGMAYLFREAAIPLYGIDRGTTKMNHPWVGILIPPSRDKNYGVDIFVPSKLLDRARKLVADEERVRECAEREAIEGPEHHSRFARQALKAKQRDAEARKERRRQKRGRLLHPFKGQQS